MANKVKAKTHKGLSKVVKKRKGGSYKYLTEVMLQEEEDIMIQKWQVLI